MSERIPVPDADLPVEERPAYTPATDTVKVPAQGDPEPSDPGESPEEED